MATPTIQDRVEYALTRLLEAGVNVLPDRVAPRFGAAVGRLVQAPLEIRRKVVRANLRRAFPDAGHQWWRETEDAVYRHLGREAVEMIRLSHQSPEQIVALTDTPDWAEFEEARREGKGVILVTGHYGNWEVAAAAVSARGVPIEAVVKRQRNRLVDARLQAARARLGIGTIYMGSAPHRVPRVLAKGGVVGIVGDQDAHDRGIFVPFFGIPASTFRGPALFALRFGAAVFASIARRNPDGRYTVSGKRVDYERTGDLEGDQLRLTAALAAGLEAEIRVDPTQYFWFHKRWRTPPPAELPPELFGINAVDRPPPGDG